MFYTRLIRSTQIRWFASNVNYLSLRNFSPYKTCCNFFRTECYCPRYLSTSVRKSLEFIRPYSSENELKCWNCNQWVELKNFACKNCGMLQRPNPDMTYFQLMDQPEIYDLNANDISNKYKSLQKMFHPDKFVQKSKEEIDISDQYSRLVNKAYATLKNPLSRGLYILNLRGLTTEDDSIKMNQEFLMEILEKNEEVENLNDANAILQFEKENTKIIMDYVAKASRAFEKKDFEEARLVLMKMKYFVNIDSELKKKKSVLGVVV